MQGKPLTSQRESRTTRLLDVIKDQGRSFTWLAGKTGYSESQISRVANGHHPGSSRFHAAMRMALGEDYAA